MHEIDRIILLISHIFVCANPETIHKLISTRIICDKISNLTKIFNS